MEKLINVIKFLKECGVEVEPVKLSTAVFLQISLYSTLNKNSLKKLHEITGDASALSVDTLAKGEGVCVSVTIPICSKKSKKTSKTS